MRNKIFTFCFILIFIILIIAGFFSYFLTQHFYKKELEEKLINCALLIGHQVLDESTNDAISQNGSYFQNQARTYSNLLSNNAKSASNKVRITFIDFDGKVLGESEKDISSMENHLNRKEILEAIEGKIGKDIRYSGTIEMNFLYIALPLKEIRTIVRVSLPLMQIQKIYKIILRYELLGIFIAIIATMLITYKFSSDITNPISELIIKSREISDGNYSVKVEANLEDEIGQLAITFNEMASKLEYIVSQLKENNLVMDTILNSMTDAIIAVDNNMNVVLINSVAYSLFNISSTTNVIGLNLLETIRINQIYEMLKETIYKKVVLSQEIIFMNSSNSTSNDKILRVSTMPIKQNPDEHNEKKSLPLRKTYHYKNEFSNEIFRNINFIEGAVLTVEDITNIKKLERIRTEFVSNVTHELKTPLTSIRGFVETLRDGAIHDEEVSMHFLDIIDIEAERLYSLINDILQLAEIESGKEDINVKKYNIKQSIDETLSILKPEADKRSISINIDVQDNLVITANKDRIKQMFINLIDNAIKYNKLGGTVCIKVYKTENNMVIKVMDTGIGIPEEHIPRIFERFYRVDKGRSRNMGGTGLGLAIVKHIVNLYDGSIEVNSRLSEGTEFIITMGYSSHH